MQYTYTRELLVLIVKLQKVENRKNLFLLMKKKKKILKEKKRKIHVENHE